MYAAETFCMTGTSVHIKNTRIKQLCNHEGLKFFPAAFGMQKLIRTFKKQAPGNQTCMPLALALPAKHEIKSPSCKQSTIY